MISLCIMRKRSDLIRPAEIVSRWTFSIIFGAMGLRDAGVGPSLPKCLCSGRRVSKLKSISYQLRTFRELVAVSILKGEEVQCLHVVTIPTQATRRARRLCDSVMEVGK